MKYSKEEREEIYINAAVEIAEGREFYCCHALFIGMGKELPAPRTIFFKEWFEEFKMFEPFPNVHVWFDSPSPKAKEDRINCLLLCAEMCKN